MDLLAELVGESAPIEAVRDQIRRLLVRRETGRRLPAILITGETGSGKGLVAQTIHRAGPRAGGPFVDVNCAAIPETLLEAELFGFERGAFTDARRSKPGLFQAAHRGTIFLDEVGLLPEPLQAKLLKVLEEQAVRRLGATAPEPIDVWIISATNADLQAAVRQKSFREDLYHRLAVLTLRLPALRERGNDVLTLAERFLARACADYGLSPKRLAPDAEARLLAYPWPGNVRELGNVMERVALLAESEVVTGDMLELQAAAVAGPAAAPAAPAPGPVSLDDAMRDHMVAVLTQTGWNISRTAALLGISRNTLRARIEKYALRQGESTAPIQQRVTPIAVPLPTTAAPPSVPAPASLSLRWDRRRVALLRAILVPASEEPEAPRDTSRTLDAIIEKIASFGGRPEGVSPTGVIGVFGLEAPEDAAARAAHSATAILKATEREWREGGPRVEVKLGIHVSQVLVGLAGGRGEIALEERQRLWPLLEELLQAAEPNTILVSEAAAAFLRRRFEVVPAAAGAAPKIYRLAGRERVGLEVGGRLTRFVGRQHELDLLRSRLDSAKRGQGQIVGIGGDAGIGKSRLIFEFRQGLAAQPRVYLEGHCHSHGAAMPYLPALDLLREICGITDADVPEAIAQKIRLGLTAAGMDSVAAAPYLLQVLGVKEGRESLALLSPEAVKTRIFETLRQLVIRRSREAALIIVLEDLHWIDRTSEEFFASLAEHIGGARILMVSTYRSGYRPPWIEKSYATQMALQPLAPEDCLSLMESVLESREVADPLARRILARAEGNPFFIEELARAAAERGGLPPDPGVPETIQDVLLARVERLPDAARRLLQAASVLGREAHFLLLRAVWDGPEDLDGLVRELARLEFLYEASGAEETVYVFKHSLTHEVAYESLAPSRRQVLHGMAGHSLEALYADRLEEACDRLAYHYGRTKDDEKAIRYLTMAADRSARGYAHVEAVEALRAARDRVEHLAAAPGRDRRVVDLALREAHSLHFLGRFDETRDLLLLYQGRVEQLDDPACAGPYHFWLGRTYSLLGNHEQTGASIRRAVELARACDDTGTLGKAHFMLAYEDYWSGQPVQGVAHGREAISLLERTDERWWLGMAQWVVALNCIPLGDFEAGRDATERANAVGEEIGDLRLQNYAAWTRGWIEATRGEWELGLDACRRALDRSQDPVNTAYSIGQMGYAYLEGGDVAQAIPLLNKAIDLWTRFHVRQTAARFMASLSEAYLATGQLELAGRLARDSLEISRGVKFLYVVGLAHRAAGKVAHARGDLSGAGREFEEAFETFRTMGARFELARTQVAQAELARASRDDTSAARHLREAAEVFRSLGVPRHEERAAQLARAWSLDL